MDPKILKTNDINEGEEEENRIEPRQFLTSDARSIIIFGEDNRVILGSR